MNNLVPVHPLLFYNYLKFCKDAIGQQRRLASFQRIIPVIRAISQQTKLASDVVPAIV